MSAELAAAVRAISPGDETPLHSHAIQDAFAGLLAQIPGWANFAAELRADVADAGFAIVSELDCDLDGLVIAVALCFGRPQLQPDPSGDRLLFEVRSIARPYSRSTGPNEFELHTDSATSAAPERFIALACSVADPDGNGLSLLLTADEVHRALEEADPAAVEMLSTPVAELEGANGVVRGQILWKVGDQPRIRFRADMVRRDTATPGVKQAVDSLATTLAEARPRTILLNAGEMLVIDNERVLHGRTAFSAKSPRLLRRVKIR